MRPLSVKKSTGKGRWVGSKEKGIIWLLPQQKNRLHYPKNPIKTLT